MFVWFFLSVNVFFIERTYVSVRYLPLGLVDLANEIFRKLPGKCFVKSSEDLQKSSIYVSIYEGLFAEKLPGWYHVVFHRIGNFLLGFSHVVWVFCQANGKAAHCFYFIYFFCEVVVFYCCYLHDGP